MDEEILETKLACTNPKRTTEHSDFMLLSVVSDLMKIYDRGDIITEINVDVKYIGGTPHDTLIIETM